MGKKDWEEVCEVMEKSSKGLLSTFLASDQTFLPNEILKNPFQNEKENFSATDFGKIKPGQWIPVYYKKDLPNMFHDLHLMPIRAGQAEFFFYKGEMFFDLEHVVFQEISTQSIHAIENFFPVTLKAKFQRNENAYLNKAIALGYINHFVEQKNFEIFQQEIETKGYKRLLYGQFGKIKITNSLEFKSTKGCKLIKPGFEFEIDLVLENSEEIIVFEAKTGECSFKNFSLLQLYYPLIYLRSIIQEPKKIRTIFIDITSSDDNKESYSLVEILFKDDLFDKVELLGSSRYIYLGL